MKKFYFVIAGFLCLFSFVSCSNEIEEEIQINDYQDQIIVRADPDYELLWPYQQINDGITDNEVINGSLLDNFLRACAVAYADVRGAAKLAEIGGEIGALAGPEGAAAGATVGAIIGGTGASYIAYRTTRSSDYYTHLNVTSAYVSAIEKKAFTQLIPTNPPLPNNQYYNASHISLGYKHNILMNFLFQEDFSNTNHEDILTYEECLVINSLEYEEAYNTVANHILQGTLSQYVGIDSNVTKVIDRFLGGLKKCSNSETLQSLVNDYITTTELNSLLSTKEKDNIKSFVLLGLQSVNFWNDYYRQH